LNTNSAITDGTCGRITAQYVFSRPTRFSCSNTGTISTCGALDPATPTAA
jgi:hypothetical protein